MRIDQLRVRNFRCFEEREFALNPRFNVLVGENGSGKTAVLEALSVAIGSLFLGLKGCGERHLRRQDARLRVFSSGREWTFEPQYPVEVEAVGEVASTPLRWMRTLATDKGRTTSYAAKEIKRVASALDRSVGAGDDVILPLVAFYGTGRLWLQPRDRGQPSSGGKEELSRRAGYWDAIDPRCNPRELMRWIERQDYAAYQEGGESPLYRTVKRAMLAMVENARDIRYAPRRKEVVVTFEGGDPQAFENLSDGQRSMLALAGDIATRMARLNPHLGERALTETPGVVLIDEMDLHLHPTWQRHLVEDLRTTFPSLQFIGTTHSPFIIQTLREGELITLDDHQPLPNLGSLGIAEIAEGVMGVDNAEVSPRYQAMVGVAHDYLSALDKAAVYLDEPLETFKERLAEQIAPYADNPAFQAYLERKQAVALGE
jgi:predicted ATP-binding protein involved in virulence